MFNAISSMLSKTIDIFIKINSAESRRHRFAKDIFELYKALDEVADSLERISLTVKDFADLNRKPNQTIFSANIPEYIVTRSFGSDGTVEIQTPQLADDGSIQFSPPKKVRFSQLLPSVLACDIRALNASIGKIAGIMGAASWDLFRLSNQPEKLRVLGIFDDNIVSTFNKAWFKDGGFVEALHHLRLDQKIDGKVLKLFDAEFDPRTSPAGYDVEGKETRFSLEKKKDIMAFVRLASRCRSAVLEARDAVRKFLAEKCAVEDIL